jgi:hypothetical protein
MILICFTCKTIIPENFTIYKSIDNTFCSKKCRNKTMQLIIDKDPEFKFPNKWNNIINNNHNNNHNNNYNYNCDIQECNIRESNKDIYININIKYLEKTTLSKKSYFKIICYILILLYIIYFYKYVYNIKKK